MLTAHELMYGQILDTTLQVQEFFEKVGNFDHLVSSSGRKKDVPFLQASLAELWAPWEEKYWVFVKAARYGWLHCHGTVFSCLWK